MKIETLILLIILFLAVLLRFYQLGVNPVSLYWDEVSLGYNAYSILKTGRDEFGVKIPLDKFIAFGDYKPIGYVYSTVIPIAIFGLNEFAIRFPSALAGSLMVVITYFLTKKLLSEKIALISSFLLAISPWSLHLSRAAFEANLAAFLNLLGIYFFVKGAKEKGEWLVLAFISFIAAFYTFNSNRILSPLFIILLTLIYNKDLLIKKRWFIVSLTISLMLIIPIIPYLRSRESRLRFNEVNIFSDFNTILVSNARIDVDGNTRLAKIIHHRYISHGLNFLKHYFDNFSADFLFISGDGNPRLSVRSVGELYLVELPFFLIGIYFLLANIKNRNNLLILAWFLLAPLPAATARETPHALRILSILPTPQIVSAIGIYIGFNYLKVKKYSKLFTVSLFFLFGINFFYYLYSYYVTFPKTYAGEWLDGYKQAVYYVKDNELKHNKIYVTNYYGRPYIYFLFYNKYPPERYINEVIRERDWFGNWQVLSFNKFIFADNPNEDRGKTLYLAPPDKFVTGFSLIGQIKKTNGESAFNILER